MSYLISKFYPFCVAATNAMDTFGLCTMLIIDLHNVSSVEIANHINLKLF